jgi:hypothetical protein
MITTMITSGCTQVKIEYHTIPESLRMKKLGMIEMNHRMK